MTTGDTIIVQLLVDIAANNVIMISCITKNKVVSIRNLKCTA